MDILVYSLLKKQTMTLDQALIVFDALSQETRLKVIRLLVPAGPKGMPAGDIGKHLSIPHNTLSFHLTHLANATLVTSRKEGRSVYYALNFDQIRRVIKFLVQDCCRFDTTHQSANTQNLDLSALDLFCPPNTEDNIT